MEYHDQKKDQIWPSSAAAQDDSGGLDAHYSQPQQIYGFTVDTQYQATYGTTPQIAEVAQQHGIGPYSQYAANVTYSINQPQIAQLNASAPMQVYNHPLTAAQTIGLTSSGITNMTPQLDLATAPTSQPYVLQTTPTSEHDLYAPQQQQQQTQSQMSSNEQPLEAVQRQLRQIFTFVRENAARDAGARLLETSRYLLGGVEAFDDPSQNASRLRLWDGFNQAWLVTLQKQLDLTTEQQQPQTNQSSLMDVEMLSGLSSELVRLCDGVERHGLVDYQMGVAEEEIVDTLQPKRAEESAQQKEQARAAQSSAAGSSSKKRAR